MHSTSHAAPTHRLGGQARLASRACAWVLIIGAFVRTATSAMGQPDVSHPIEPDHATSPTPTADEASHAQAHSQAHAQPTRQTMAPTLAPSDRALRRKRWISLGAVAGTYLAFSTWMYFAWYHNQPNLPAFLVGGDGWFGQSTYAGGADKVGHFWSNHALSRGTTRILRRGGWKPLTASLMGSGLSCALFVYVEIKDGFYYQFSPGDLAGNTAGCLASIAMENLPALDRMIDFRVQYFPSPEFRKSFQDGDVDVAEDYSGQTFLLAAHLGELPWLRDQPAARYLRYVDVAVGFKSRNYKPDPEPEDHKLRRQTLFLGLSLNAQGIWDDVFARHPTARKIGHGIFEVANLPYTTWPALKASRSPDE